MEEPENENERRKVEQVQKRDAGIERAWESEASTVKVKLVKSLVATLS